MEAILVKCPKWIIIIPGWAVVPSGGWYSSQCAVCQHRRLGVRWCTMTQPVGQGKPTDNYRYKCK